MQCLNFICYRGSSSAGLGVAQELVLAMKPFMREQTYFSPEVIDKKQMQYNFLKDPEKYIGSVKNFIIVLTKNFFSGFGYKNISVTQIELEELFKNPQARIIKIVFPDFDWDDTAGETNLTNRELVKTLFGEEAMERLVGALPLIPYAEILKKEIFRIVIETICAEDDKRKKVVIFDFDGTLTKQKQGVSNTWEALWLVLGLPLSDCAKYHTQFSSKKLPIKNGVKLPKLALSKRNVPSIILQRLLNKSNYWTM